MIDKLKPFSLAAASFVVVLVFWEVSVLLGGWNNEQFASPLDIVAALFEFRLPVLLHLWESVWRTLAGLLLAVLAGFIVGIGMGFSTRIRRAVFPLLIVLEAVPKPALAMVLGLLLVGFHDLNTILIAFLVSFVSIAVAVKVGLSDFDPDFEGMLISLGASKQTIFWKIRLPKSIPEFFEALKFAAPLAFMGTNIAEIVDPHGKGLGHLIGTAVENSSFPLMFAVLLILSIVTLALYFLVDTAARYLGIFIRLR